jgi:hypothetical protein
MIIDRENKIKNHALPILIYVGHDVDSYMHVLFLHPAG